MKKLLCIPTIHPRFPGFFRLALDSTGALEASYELGDWDEVLDLELDFHGKIWENMGKSGKIWENHHF